MRALIVPQEQAPNAAPESVSMVRMVTAKEEISTRLHKGAVEISRLKAALSHLRGKAKVKQITLYFIMPPILKKK